MKLSPMRHPVTYATASTPDCRQGDNSTPSLSHRRHLGLTLTRCHLCDTMSPSRHLVANVTPELFPIRQNLRPGTLRRKRACIGYPQKRPAAESPSVAPTRRGSSDRGKVSATVTGVSALAVGILPSLELGPGLTEAHPRMEKETELPLSPCRSHGESENVEKSKIGQFYQGEVVE